MSPLPDLALDIVDVREHARRSIENAIESLGFALGVRRAMRAGIEHPSRSVAESLHLATTSPA